MSWARVSGGSDATSDFHAPAPWYRKPRGVVPMRPLAISSQAPASACASSVSIRASSTALELFAPSNVSCRPRAGAMPVSKHRRKRSTSRRFASATLCGLPKLNPGNLRKSNRLSTEPSCVYPKPRLFTAPVESLKPDFL